MVAARRPIIIHVDMDAFYAAVEVREDPSLAGKALIIGALPTERGVVATCSYEARKYGVHSAMNIKEAYRLCPHGVYMHPDFEKYRKVSARLREIWNDYAVRMEPVALDEAYLDVTYSAGTFERAGEMAREIKARVRAELDLSCSVGVAYSKTAAKTASEEKKPDGYFEIPTPEDFVALMIDRDVRSLYTVGAKTAGKLNRLGIYTVRDIQNRADEIVEKFGKHGRLITELAFGIDERKVVAYKPQDAKSISREVTFQEDVKDYGLLKDVLVLLALCVQDRARRHNLRGQGVTLKLTYADMRSISRSRTITGTADAATIYTETVRMLEQLEAEDLAELSGDNPAQPGQSRQAEDPDHAGLLLRPVRLIGAGIYNMSAEEARQMTLDDYLNENPDELAGAASECPGSDPEKGLLNNPAHQPIIDTRLRELQAHYGLDFAGHLEDIYHGNVLHRTIEYMRRHY